MSENFPAFSISPVPQPGPDTAPPELFRGVYGMPMFVTAPTSDLAASLEFWAEGLGFFDFFTVPGQVTHLRRWAFQDVLLVPGERPGEAPASSVTFSCLLSQVDAIVAACEKLRPGSTQGPRQMPWGTVEVEVTTPENTRVIMTAARPFDPRSAEAAYLRESGFDLPEAPGA
ncbi:VOC family protein [Nocardiopsis sp. NPDC006938]|uniref:VOC family protein n=1 Tax=Nocardiopsis sp. NPDC006938 TaxID=3364337 RepID=UPI00368F0B51